VNQAMARKYFGAENPIGRRFGWSAETASEIEIVGVVRDAKTINVRSEADPTLYIPYRQQTSAAVRVAVGTEADPRFIIPEIKRVFNAADASLMITNVRTTEQALENFMTRERLFATLTSFFGVLAVPMVCIGLYGLVSYTMLRRTKEIGIRMALGAQPQWIRFMVLRQFLRLICAGLLVGVAGTWAASRVIASMLYAVSPTDPVTYTAVAVGLAAVTLVACWVPARRAARVDPMIALRAE
jgi:ABC-type antimicrobial peptide transport system permease subunit